MWMCEWGVGRWWTSFPNFDYPNHRGFMSLPPGDQIFKQNADTRQECLHRRYSFALLLYHRSKMLSIELGAQNNRGQKELSQQCFFHPKMEGVMFGYYPLQKRGSILLHCNVFAPKKYCGTTTFFCDFDGGNMFPCQTPKTALSALHFL